MRRDVQRRSPPGVERVHVGIRIQQRLRDAAVTNLGGEVKRVCAPFAFPVKGFRYFGGAVDVRALE